MNADKNTIGMTPENRSVMDKIIRRNLFDEQMQAAKFAMSLAINADIEPGQAVGTDTSWNVGSFDREGEIKNLLSALYPDNDTPYRLAEHLINSGLELVGRHFGERQDIVMTELIKTSP